MVSKIKISYKNRNNEDKNVNRFMYIWRETREMRETNERRKTREIRDESVLQQLQSNEQI